MNSKVGIRIEVIVLAGHLVHFGGSSLIGWSLDYRRVCILVVTIHQRIFRFIKRRCHFEKI